MNLNKFTKAELISKLNKLDAKNESNNNKNSILNQIKSYLSQIWVLMITFKNILIKLTLFSFIIQIFKKYKFYRRLWLMLNTIVMTIFGISLLDNIGFDFLTNFFIEIRIIAGSIVDYLTNTQFYNFLNKLLRISDKNDIKESIPSTKSKEYPGKSDGVWTPSDNPQHKVSEWLKSREIKEIPEEIKEESFNYKKYLIISGFIIGSCLVWFYFDEIKSGSMSFWEWMKSFRPGPSSDGSTDTEHGTNVISTHVQQTSESNLISPVMTPDIELIDTNPRPLTSPSFDNLSDSVRESWERFTSPRSPDSALPGSPDSGSSSSSTETVTQASAISSETVTQASTSSSENITASSSGALSNILTRAEIEVIDEIKNTWKDLIPSSAKARIIFIENQVFLDGIDNPGIKSQMVHYLAHIENVADIISMRCSQMDSSEPENGLLQSQLIIQLLNNWIKQYHDLIFPR